MFGQYIIIELRCELHLLQGSRFIHKTAKYKREFYKAKSK